MELATWREESMRIIRRELVGYDVEYVENPDLDFCDFIVRKKGQEQRVAHHRISLSQMMGSSKDGGLALFERGLVNLVNELKEGVHEAS